MKTRTFLYLILISLLALSISACKTGGHGTTDDTGGTTSTSTPTTPAATQTISGVVTGPGGLITMLENKTLWASALDSVFPLAHAATANGLEPIDGAIIELILIEDADIADDADGRGILVGGEVIATTTSGTNGSFSINTTETLDSHLVLRVISPDVGDIVMRAIVNGTTVNISPASEYVLREILGAIVGFNGGTLEHFRNDEIQELFDSINEVVANMDMSAMDMSTGDLEYAIYEIDEASESIDFDDDVDAKIAINFSGTWTYSATVTAGTCGIANYSGSVNVISQDGTELIISDTINGETIEIEAKIDDSSVTWEIDLGGDLTGTERGDITVLEDGSTASGTITITATGAGACTSTAVIDASLIGA